MRAVCVPCGFLLVRNCTRRHPWFTLKKPCDPWRYSHDVFRFRHRFAVLDMKPDMKSKHHDVVPISS
jgi:hypothetical protein